MATRIHDLDLEASPPDSVPLDGYDRLWLVGWRAGRPVGAVMLEPSAGQPAIASERIAAAAEAFAARGRGSGVPVDVPADAGVTDAGAAGAAGAATADRRQGHGPSISVVICTRDRPDALPTVLEALGRQSRPDFELIVVDNAPSDDGTRRVLREWWPEAHYVVDPVPGLPHARNAGVAAARGDVVAFTDDDCRPVPGWIEAIEREFSVRPGPGCVTGPILPMELETRAQEALERRGGFNRGFERFRHVLGATIGLDAVQAWRFGSGGNFAVSRACLDALGGFDDSLTRSEDLDLLYRVVRSGRALIFEPAAALHHRHPRSWSGFRRRMFYWGWGYLTYLDKITCTDTPAFAEHAKLEKRNWLSYQLRDRLRPALRGRADVPLSAVSMEIVGGLAGYYAYPLVRRWAARRGAVHSPAPVARDAVSRAGFGAQTVGGGFESHPGAASRGTSAKTARQSVYGDSKLA